MYHLLVVAAGGAVGAALRHLANLAALRFAGLTFPWGTLTVNIVGSFLMGVFIEWLARRVGASAELRLFVATGILGGFTTFSAFSLDVAVLWERGAHAAAAGYVAASVAGAIAALFAGLMFARTFA
ncbi:MAG: fluoride efflux transporter CrcB [Rhizobiaceae bacterium]|nr:fluoride efflux transporter CrcB [Rhizobiaceae bacterium]